MFHSDQGAQYSAKLFREKLALFNITQSMSRRGSCWDNSVMERLLSRLKTEKLTMPLIKTTHKSLIKLKLHQGL